MPWVGPAPSGIHHSRNNPITWSTRIPPECRSTVDTSRRNGSYAVSASSVRPPRRLVPVLAVLVVRVRRRTDRDALGEAVLQRPGVGPDPADPDREIGHQRRAPSRPAAPPGARPRAARPAPTAASSRSRSRRRGPRGTPPRPPPAGCRSSSGQLRRIRAVRSRTAPTRSRSRAAPDPRAAGSLAATPSRPAVRGTAKMILQRGPLDRPARVPVDGRRPAPAGRPARPGVAGPRRAGRRRRSAYSGIRSGRR